MHYVLSVCLFVHPSVCPSVCLPVRPSICLSVCPSICLSNVCLSSVRPMSVCHLSVCPPICLSVHVSVPLSVCLYVLPSLCLSVCPSVCPMSVCLCLCLSVCLSIRLSVSLSVCLSIWLSAYPPTPCQSMCLSFMFVSFITLSLYVIPSSTPDCKTSVISSNKISRNISLSSPTIPFRFRRQTKYERLPGSKVLELWKSALQTTRQVCSNNLVHDKHNTIITNIVT